MFHLRGWAGSYHFLIRAMQSQQASDVSGNTDTTYLPLDVTPETQYIFILAPVWLTLLMKVGGRMKNIVGIKYRPSKIVDTVRKVRISHLELQKPPLQRLTSLSGVESLSLSLWMPVEFTPSNDISPSCSPSIFIAIWLTATPVYTSFSGSTDDVFFNGQLGLLPHYSAVITLFRLQKCD